MERLKKHDIVQHFKKTIKKDLDLFDYVYEILEIAEHTETKEKLVIYKALYRNDELGVNFGVYARPYDMFMSEVDHEKYPQCTEQLYRFQVTPLTQKIKEEMDSASEKLGYKITDNIEVFKEFQIAMKGKI